MTTDKIKISRRVVRECIDRAILKNKDMPPEFVRVLLEIADVSPKLLVGSYKRATCEIGCPLYQADRALNFGPGKLDDGREIPQWRYFGHDWDKLIRNYINDVRWQGLVIVIDE